MFERLVEQAQRRSDGRGHLDVLYESAGMVLKRSFSCKGVFRGMHLQRPPHAQVKLIRVQSGRILDFLMLPSETPAPIWNAELAPADGWVMIGAEFAHGFYALEDSEFEYICDGGYEEGSEEAYSILGYLREVLGLNEVILSDKDKAAKVIAWRKA